MGKWVGLVSDVFSVLSQLLRIFSVLGCCLKKLRAYVLTKVHAHSGL